jgi:hypothetical protein
MNDTTEVTDITPIKTGSVATAPQGQVVTTPDDLLRMAVAQGAGLDYLERLMAMKERFDALAARRAFVEAMANFKTEPLDIFKKKSVGYTTKEGDFVGYKHAELSDIADVVVPALARHGLSHRWQVKQEAGRITVICEVTHRAGHMESVLMDAAPDSSGKKNQIQQVASAITYLQRYTLLAVCGLATKSEHDDGRGAGGAAEDHESEVLSTLLEDLKEKLTDEDARQHYITNSKKLGNVKLQSQFKAAVVKHREALKTQGATA